MRHFIESYWDKLLVAAVAIYGAVLSTYTFFGIKEKERLAARAEISRVLWDTKEIARKVVFLDALIDQRFFTRRQDILDALTGINEYWKKNEASLSRFLSTETYQPLYRLYEFVLTNEDNQPPPNGQGVWLCPEKLLDQKVTGILENAATNLQKKLA